MTTERAFVLGVALGVAGSVIPDLPSAITMHNDRPEMREWVWSVYLIFALIVVWVLMEVMQ